MHCLLLNESSKQATDLELLHLWRVLFQNIHAIFLHLRLFVPFKASRLNIFLSVVFVNRGWTSFQWENMRTHHLSLLKAEYFCTDKFQPDLTCCSSNLLTPMHVYFTELPWLIATFFTVTACSKGGLVSWTIRSIWIRSVLLLKYVKGFFPLCVVAILRPRARLDSRKRRLFCLSLDQGQRERRVLNKRDLFIFFLPLSQEEMLKRFSGLLNASWAAKSRVYSWKRGKELLSHSIRVWTAALESKVYRPCNNHGSNYGMCYYKSAHVPRLCDCPPILSFQKPHEGHNDKLLCEARGV